MMWLLRMMLVSTMVLVAYVAWMSLTKAAEPHVHNDGTTYEAVIGDFYRTWTMPDARHLPCCNNEDCRPTVVRQDEFGHYQAFWDEGGIWVTIPDRKMEWDKDSPDGRGHACIGSIPDVDGNRQPYVYCAIIGAGG